MRTHARHIAIATVVVLILLVIASVAARAEDFSKHSGARPCPDSVQKGSDQ